MLENKVIIAISKMQKLEYLLPLPLGWFWLLKLKTLSCTSRWKLASLRAFLNGRNWLPRKEAII